jgi:predicted TIM-barrel fold metal-dependent hydrolase
MPRRLFSADSHCVILSDQVKKNLATQFHADWDAGMAKFDAQRGRAMNGQRLEAARHPGYFDSRARLAAMDADGVECEVMYSEFDFTSKVYQVGARWKECATAYNDTLHQFASVAPKRILITYQLPLIEIDYAVSEIERLAA